VTATLPRLTCVQREVLDFCAEYIDREGQFPTYREICESFGWQSQSTAFEHLEALEREGAVARVGARGAGSRAFILTDAGLGVVGREVLSPIIARHLRLRLSELAEVAGDRVFTVHEMADALGLSLEDR